MNKAKFAKFGLTIHPKGGELVNWLQLTKEEISAKLKELEYPTPLELARVLKETQIFKETKKNKATGKENPYYSVVTNFGGQLELGEKNGTPHYQCWIELSSKQTDSKVLGYYSKKIYNESRSNAVGVIVLTNDSEMYENYCTKEDRADLTGAYKHINIDPFVGEIEKYLEDNPDAKKYLRALLDIKGT